MTKLPTQFIDNFIAKYIEVYTRTIEAGYDEVEAHKICREFFVAGFKAVA
jgi:hypothetical protein